jgi:Fic family protein
VILSIIAYLGNIILFKHPPCTINAEILESIQEICIILGRIDHCSFRAHSNIHLRKETNIRSIKSSLAIEGHVLDLDQISDVLNDKRVIAPKNDIVAVKNAISVYEAFDQFDVFSMDDLLLAHELMMKDLLPDAGKFRNTGVGLFKGREVVHIAPPHHNVSGLMVDLFAYLKKSKDSLLLKSCIFHYEFEFIHPFIDGNGRMGHLWQQLILSQQHPVFKLVCIEELLEKYQENYYEILQICDSEGNSGKFAEFMLGIILRALKNTKSQLRPTMHGNFIERLNYAKNFLNDFKRKDYLNLFEDLSTATASRDLLNGVKNGFLETTDTKNQTMYRFKK